MSITISLDHAGKVALFLGLAAIACDLVWRLVVRPWIARRRWLHAHADDLAVSWSWFERASTIRARLRETWLRWSPPTVLGIEKAVAAIPGVRRVDVREDHDLRRVVVRVQRRWFTRRLGVLGRVHDVIERVRPLGVRIDIEEG